MTTLPHRIRHSGRRRSGRGRRLPAGALAAACPLVAGLALAGCGGASHTARVASLPQHGGPQSHRSTVPAGGANEGVPDPDGRPREPLNDTNAQFDSLFGPWTACLRAHRYIDALTGTARLAVVARCEHLEPLPPWQLDPANPQARAFVGRVVTCLMGKGYHARADLDSQGGAIAIPEWTVMYSPTALNYTPRRPVTAEDDCHSKALG